VAERLRTYAQELAAIEAVVRGRPVEARTFGRPDLWQELRITLSPRDGYGLWGKRKDQLVFVGGVLTATCALCLSLWQELPCRHQLGMAALWVGGHPIRLDVKFDHALALKIEGRIR
jgi:hypothetical protein